MSKIKIACIGAGYFAKFHVEAWTRIPEVEVVAICDKDLEKAEKLAKEYNVTKAYDSVTLLLQSEDFQVVDIITPPDTHLELVQQFATAGKHIICQKPLAPTLIEAETIVELTNKAGVRFMVHENFRFQPWYRQMKRLLEQGVIGDQLHTLNLKMRMGDGWGERAYLDRQPYFQTMERLLIYETGIHYIDVFRFLAGKIESVYARLRKLNPVIAGEDCALILFDFKNGGQGVLDGNRYNEANYENARYTFGLTTIEGNAGTIRLYQNGKIMVQPIGKEEYESEYVHEDKNFAGDCVYFTQKHFIENLIQNKPFETNGEDYLINLQIQEAIYQSNKWRKEILIHKKIEFMIRPFKNQHRLWVLFYLMILSSFFACQQYMYKISAIEDYQSIEVEGFVNPYVDKNRKAIAINAGKFKNQYGAAIYTFNGKPGKYNLQLNALAELDGESNYRIAINENLLAGSKKNPQIFGTGQPDYTPVAHVWKNVQLKKGDTIRVEFSSETNGKIPEGDITAYSRGRFTGIELTKIK